MSKEIPTPYMWSYQPQMGLAAGAAQDYSSKMNWLSAGPHMISRVNGIRAHRNQILLEQAAITATPRRQLNPPSWPAAQVYQENPRPTTVLLPRDAEAEVLMTNSGVQLAGGSRYARYRGRAAPYSPGSIKRVIIRGRGIQLNDETVSSSTGLRPDGVFQLGGAGRSSFTTRQAYLTLQSSSSQPRSGGIGTLQFVEEFVPSVYFNPFSGSPGRYPDAFIPNFDAVSESVDGYD
ncbi:pVIII [Rhesus adenovirus 59]|uniref:Pre-hexon-linking protein VIII n=1 Tax=simian adenovirus 1 TaxID=310540 RepID=Q5C8P3_9ADEN|nr:pVIII [Simian adenovirus 1]AUG71609.1 pVIII [Rhesus adenovirus 54]AUG71722.1 pVIII [Rhesus adenovirus 59]AUG71768.1 pVIII [Rhesus adenovirus 61]AUG71910.1 pVIII [Rhesus adenovirus 67]AAX19414.1 pVIII [Simian adenovirus 1]